MVSGFQFRTIVVFSTADTRTIPRSLATTHYPLLDHLTFHPFPLLKHPFSTFDLRNLKFFDNNSP